MSASTRKKKWAGTRERISVLATARDVAVEALEHGLARCAEAEDFAACMAVEDAWDAFLRSRRTWDDCARAYHVSFSLAESAESR